MRFAAHFIRATALEWEEDWLRGGYCSGEELRLATFARRSSGECARGDAFFEECWGVEMKISLRESSTFAKVRRVKGV